jgi:hypothetical protein
MPTVKPDRVILIFRIIIWRDVIWPTDDVLNYPFIAGFGALYGLLIMHVMPALVYLTFVNAFKGNLINLKPFRPGQCLELKSI